MNNSMKNCETLFNPFDTDADFQGQNLFGSTDEGGETEFGAMLKCCQENDSERAKSHWGFNIETERPLSDSSSGQDSLRWDYSVTADYSSAQDDSPEQIDDSPISEPVNITNKFRPRKFTGGSDISGYYSLDNGSIDYPTDDICISASDCNGNCDQTDHVEDILCKIEIQNNTATC
jgi:hypothetical protein